jgi:hypothetical protein
VSSSVDTEFWLYYGNLYCSDQENPEGVWDANFVMVQHMDGANAGGCDDSTSNNNDVTAEAGIPVYQQTGKIDYAVDFDECWLEVPTSTSLDLVDGTVEAWIRPESFDNWQGLVCKRYQGCFPADDGWTWAIRPTDQKLRYWYVPSGALDTFSTGSVSSGVWQHVAFTISGGTLTHYINGASSGSDSGFAFDNDECNTVTIGGWDAVADYDFNGQIDEIRISNTARSSDWLSTSYNNQNNPAAFLSVGAEENGGSTYGSPLFMGDVEDTWTLSSFVWQNAGVSEGTRVGWRIYYRDSSGNSVMTDVMSFMVGEEPQNNPPDQPDITSGPTLDYITYECTYTAVTNDSEGHQIYYNFSWDDGNYSGWLGPYPSGSEASASHTWTNYGAYNVQVKAKDELDAESSWSESYVVDITMIGDMDNSCNVDLTDFTKFAAAYGTSQGDPDYNILADFDRMGNVDLTDFTVFASWYGENCW